MSLNLNTRAKSDLCTTITILQCSVFFHIFIFISELYTSYAFVLLSSDFFSTWKTPVRISCKAGQMDKLTQYLYIWKSISPSVLKENFAWYSIFSQLFFLLLLVYLFQHFEYIILHPPLVCKIFAEKSADGGSLKSCHSKLICLSRTWILKEGKESIEFYETQKVLSQWIIGHLPAYFKFKVKSEHSFSFLSLESRRPKSRGIKSL